MQSKKGIASLELRFERKNANVVGPEIGDGYHLIRTSITRTATGLTRSARASTLGLN